MFKRLNIRNFLSDQSGAVTPDWVVLTGAIVGVGIVMVSAIGEGADNLADTAASSYSTPRVTLVQAVSEDDTGTGDTGGDTGTGIEIVIY